MNTHFIRSLLIASGFMLATLNSQSLYAKPDGGNVVAGTATINQAGNTVTVNQSTNTTIINWNGFSIGNGETTRFNRPNSNSIALNRVIGNDPSNIFGNLIANGKIMLINPNGIMFGSSSRVDVAGLIASTADISNSDFLAGNYKFSQNPNKNFGIVNNGEISVKDQGLVALVAPGVENNGVIRANLGKVLLASGTNVGNKPCDLRPTMHGTRRGLPSERPSPQSPAPQLLLRPPAPPLLLRALIPPDPGRWRSRSG